MSYPTHIVAACGLITNEIGEVLLMRHRQRGWEVPGGQVEVGEDLIAGLQREIEEETGITVTVGKLTGVYSNLQSDENTPTKVIFAFRGERSAGNLRTSPESPEVRWVPREQVLDMVTHPALYDRIIFCIGNVLLFGCELRYCSHRFYPLRGRAYSGKIVLEGSCGLPLSVVTKRCHVSGGVAMPRTTRVAAVQMDVKPAPTLERLTRAVSQVCVAASQGAELVVLPELFNTGYAYIDENYARAESMNGQTIEWMLSTARSMNLYLAGTLLVRDGEDIYNRMLVVSPEGRTWTYDKNYPYAWERRYFKSSKKICVARTDLGDLGLMICIDTVHLSQWKRYAGKVDMIVIASCPPHTADQHYHLPGGEEVTIDQMGPLFKPIKPQVELSFTRLMSEQAAWLGVPAVNTVGCGTFESPVPDARLLMLGLVPTAPRLARYLFKAIKVSVTSQMLEGTRVVDATGQVLSEQTQAQGEGFTLANVCLADQKPAPTHPQPRSLLPAYALWISDGIAALQAGAYQKAIRGKRR